MPVHLEIRIGGGYALVDNRADDQFDVASIIPTQPAHVHHALRIRIVKGSSEPEPPLGPAGWDLETGPYRMEVWPGGAAPKGRVTPPEAEERQMFIPDVPELGRSALGKNWRKSIAARITLRAGRLSVDRQNLANGEFQFRHPTRAPKQRQKIANGENGLIFRLSDNSPDVNSVTLALFPLVTADHDILSGAVKPTAAYVVSPDRGAAVELQVDAMEDPKQMVDGMDLDEFAIFYSLLAPMPAISDQYIPRWFAGDIPRDELSVMSPGSECPMGYYDDNAE
jgi:hypothetical protein